MKSGDFPGEAVGEVATSDAKQSSSSGANRAK